MKRLIKNGYVLSIDPAIGAQKNCDVLIEDDRIVQVAPGIQADDAEVIDATDRFVLPGFIDTHRHVWQTPLHAVGSNWSMYHYVLYMRTTYAGLYTEKDAYLGNYAGALEGLNAGITTVVDHCHLVNSPAFADRLIAGLQDSGTRAVFCYGFFINPVFAHDLSGYTMEETPGWRYEDCKRVRSELLPDDKARVTFGISPSEINRGTVESIGKELDICRELGAHVISCHTGMGYWDFRGTRVSELADAGLVGPDMLFVHCSSFTEEEIEATKLCGAGISATPEIDIMMGMHCQVCSPGLRLYRRGLRTSLGTDIACGVSSEMFSPMRAQLSSQRAEDFDNTYQKDGKYDCRIFCSPEEVLYLATMGGAKAIHKEELIGSISPGKKADIQLIRFDSINMVSAADSDPYAAVVLYANVGDIDTVMVDGRLVKQNGKLVGIDWDRVSREIVASSKRIIEKYDRVDLAPAIDLWHGMLKDKAIYE